MDEQLAPSGEYICPAHGKQTIMEGMENGIYKIICCRQCAESPNAVVVYSDAIPPLDYEGE